MRRYLAETGKDLGWVVWGKRELRFTDYHEIPAWYSNAVAARKDQHLRIVSLAELGPS